MEDNGDGKKVLVITYYWPPSGGSGVQRWLKFVKYLPSLGWAPYVFTPENPSFSVKDESLAKDVPPEAEVLRFPIWEPYGFFGFLSSVFKKGSPSTVPDFFPKNDSLLNRIGLWVRGNLFIPDPRIFWVRPSVKFLENFIRDRDIRTLVTTGPPHSIHLIGYQLKKKIPALRWLADFRDPWSEWGLLNSIKTGSLARSIHRSMEKKVLARADELITITPFYQRKFEKLAQRHVHLLVNGYDEDDFRGFMPIRGSKFTLLHAGMVHEQCNLAPFFTALESLLQEDREIGNDIEVKFIGEVHHRSKNLVGQSNLLPAIVQFLPSVAHDQLMSEYASSSLLLLILTGYKDAEGYMPGKLFEYVATSIPVLGIGPVHGDASDVLSESQAGVMLAGEDTEGIKGYILKNYREWKQGVGARAGKGCPAYSRRKITEGLVGLLSKGPQP